MAELLPNILVDFVLDAVMHNICDFYGLFSYILFRHQRGKEVYLHGASADSATLAYSQILPANARIIIASQRILVKG